MKGSKLHFLDSEARQGFKRGFRKARIQAGFKTQKDFADAFDTCIDNVKNWEQPNRAIPEIDTIIRICDFLGCSLDYIFDRIDCKTHDAQFVCDYTGLDEYAVENLRNILKDDFGVMSVLNYIIRSDIFLYRLADYYISSFGAFADDPPFSFIRYSRADRMSRRLLYADLLDTLPKDRGTFWESIRHNPELARRLTFEVIRRCADESDKDYMLRKLNNSSQSGENEPELRIFAEFLNSDDYGKSIAKRLDLDLKKFYCSDREDFTNGAD